MSSDPRERVWLPVDVSTLEEAKRLVDDLMKAGLINFKVGLELITNVGAPAAVECIKQLGGNVWFDGKFCDIPNTVAGASKAVVGLGAGMFNVHAWSGKKAIQAAAAHKGSSKLLIVTVLTSLDWEDIDEMGMYDGEDEEYCIPHIVSKMAKMSHLAGADGVVCSPKELESLKEAELPQGFLKVTPGVRPTWASTDDQERVMTPGEAIKAGATALVIGRPITKPPKEVGPPTDAAKMIFEEISAAL